MNNLKYILLIVCFVISGNTIMSQDKKTENPHETLNKIESKESNTKNIQKQDGIETQSLPTKSNISATVDDKNKAKEKTGSDTVKSYQTEKGDEVFYLIDEGGEKKIEAENKNMTNTSEMIMVIRDPEKLEQLKKGKEVKTKEQ